MPFRCALELWNIDLWNIDFLDTDIFSKYFVCLHYVLRRLQDMSSRSLQGRHVFKTSWIRLQRNNFLSSKTSSDVLKMSCKMSSRRIARSFQDVIKTSSRRLGRRKIVTLKTCWRRLQNMSWRRPEDVFKTSKCLLG